MSTCAANVHCFCDVLTRLLLPRGTMRLDGCCGVACGPEPGRLLCKWMRSEGGGNLEVALQIGSRARVESRGSFVSRCTTALECRRTTGNPRSWRAIVQETAAFAPREGRANLGHLQGRISDRRAPIRHALVRVDYEAVGASRAHGVWDRTYTAASYLNIHQARNETVGKGGRARLRSDRNSRANLN